MKVSPSLPAPKMVRCSRSGDSTSPPWIASARLGNATRMSGFRLNSFTMPGTTEKTVHMTIIPAIREIMLLAVGTMNALRAVSSWARM